MEIFICFLKKIFSSQFILTTESGGMEAFNMKKKWIICISIITIAYFVLSLFDFMYIPADKYPNIIREIFFHDNEKVTVRSIGKVCQTKEGIYFLYKGRLMYMNSVGTEVKEVASDWQQIGGIMRIENDVFGVLRDKLGLYKISASSNMVLCQDLVQIKMRGSTG